MELNIQALLSSISGIKLDTELEKNLTDPNLPLEEYLKNPEAIQCFQDMKKNAIKYFDRNKIKQLIRYITEEPKDDNYETGYKFPYAASEMLRLAGKRIQEMIVFTEEDFNNKYQEENNDKIIEKNLEINKASENKIEEPKKKNQENKKENKEQEKNEENIIEDKNKVEIKKEENKEEDKNQNDSQKEDEIKNEDKKINEIKDEKEIKNEDKKDEDKNEDKNINEIKNGEDNKIEDKKDEDKKEDKKINEIKNGEDNKIEDKKEDRIEEKNDINEIKNDEKNKIEDKKEENKNIIKEKEPNDSKRNILKEALKKATLNDKIANRKYNYTKHNDILDLLLDFVTNKNAMENDVLCGYFHRILLSLMDNYLIDIFLYLFFVRTDALEQIIMHSYKRSLSFIAIRILNFKENINKILYNDMTNPGMIDIKMLESKKDSMVKFVQSSITKLITSIDLNGMKDKDGEYMKNIDLESVFSLLDDLGKIYDFLDYEDNPILQHVFKILETNIFGVYDLEKRDNMLKIYNYFVKFLTNLTNRCICLKYSDDDFYPEISIERLYRKVQNKEELDLHEYLALYLPKILCYNFREKYLCESDILGIHNIYLMDLVIGTFKYLKEMPTLFDFIILQTGFMDKCIQYFFRYQLNNIYHTKFVTFFTRYLQKADDHPLLTDYIFVKKKFPLMLTNFLTQKKDDKNFVNIYKYKSGRQTFSCIYSYVIDLIYKIQVATGMNIFNEAEIKDIGILNPGFFEFVKDENSPKNIDPFNLPIYYKQILLPEKSWNLTVNNDVNPKIKLFEKKLIFTSISKPNANNTVAIKNVSDLKNILNSMLSNILTGKNKNVKKEEPISNYNDINFWQVKNTISDEIKDKVNNNLNNNKNSGNDSNNPMDDEDELLNIAMKLEKEEEDNKKAKDPKAPKQPKILIKKVEPKDSANYSTINEINTDSHSENKSDDIKKENENQDKK